MGGEVTPPPNKRHQSQTERDLAGLAARKERDAEVAEFVCDDLTDRYEGEELKRMRADRPVEKRLEKLEEKDDQRALDIADIKLAVADIRGDQKATNASLRAIEKSIDQMAQREHVKFTATVDVDRAKQIDTVKAGADRREWVGKALAIVTGLIALATAAFAAGRC